MVDGTGLENQQVNSLAGSNPVPSARKARKMAQRAIFVVFFDRRSRVRARFVIRSEATNLAILSLPPGRQEKWPKGLFLLSSLIEEVGFERNAILAFFML